MRLARDISFPLCAFLLLATSAQTALADGEDAQKAACRDSYEHAQIHRKKGELLASRQDMRICASEACPAIVRTDCVTWLGEMEQSMPTVVFEAKTDDGNVFDVGVKLDGKVVATQLDGKAIELDPGVHSFVFEHAGKPPIEQKIIVREGEKSRLISANWTTPKPPPGPGGTVPVVPMERPVPLPVYALAGASVVGFGLFATFGALGSSLKSQENSSCAPFCPSDRVDKIKTEFLVADISLGVGVAALVTSAIFYFNRPERPVKVDPNGPGLGVHPTTGGAVLDWRASF